MKIAERCHTTRSADETRQLGAALGKRLTPGMALLLYGEMGSGKTVFVQGLAQGLGVPPECYVTSPTYSLIHEYPARLPFFHVDLYRLEGGADLEDIGIEDLFSPDHVAAVEWSERLHESELPMDHCKIEFTVKNESTRTIRLIACGLKMIDLIKETA